MNYIVIPTDNPMLAGRLRKALDKLYRHNDQVATLQAHLDSIVPTDRRDHLRKYARRKRNGCLAELATPKHEYSVWYADKYSHHVGFEIPKIVFDAMPSVPIKDALGRTLVEGVPPVAELLAQHEAIQQILNEYEAGKITKSTFAHTPECIQRQATFEADYAAYLKAWPNYCKTCHGAGRHWYSYDPSPAGVSLSPGTMEDYDPCPDCIEHGKCPRCGNEVWTEEDWDDGEPVTCPKCNWKEDEPYIFAAPEQPECFCWEDNVYG